MNIGSVFVLLLVVAAVVLAVVLILSDDEWESIEFEEDSDVWG